MGVKKTKVLLAFGTRPEAIKMAPVIKALKSSPEFDVQTVVTGQHREMLQQVLKIFEIKPDFNLEVMAPDQTLNELTSNILIGMKSVLDNVNPDILLVHGDTTTTVAAALAGYYNKVSVGHVEAGLRTGNIYSPWPEEINRKLVGGLAAVHFAPTKKAMNNLISEGVNPSSIHVTGNTVIDALLDISTKIDGDVEMRARYEKQFPLDPKKKIILVTGHRRESYGKGFQKICEALRHLAHRDDTQIIFPVHLNPNVKDVVYRELQEEKNIKLIPPQDYLPFIFLMKRCDLILTDSGGIQEEAPSLGKPVLVLRDTTERPEAIETGSVKLVGTQAAKIISEVETLLENPRHYHAMSIASNPYGDGSAAQQIKNILINL